MFASDIYTKLVNDYGDKRIEANYNRLYSLYSDNTLPTYDEQMANTIKEKMKQKGITITKIEKIVIKRLKIIHRLLCVVICMANMKLIKQLLKG